MLSCVFACVQFVVGFPFQMTSWPGLEPSSPQYSKPRLQVRGGDFRAAASSLWAYQPASHGCPQIREVAGASLTSHTPLLFVFDLRQLHEAKLFHVHSPGPRSRVPEEASRGRCRGQLGPLTSQGPGGAMQG